MDRIANVNEESVTGFRAALQENYPDYGDPLPGSALKADDDVMWLGMFPFRVLWGHDDPLYFHGYCPSIGEFSLCIEGAHITDRAPADPEETPMPIYPEEGPQQLAQQPGARDAVRPKRRKEPDAQEVKRALQDMLKQLPPENAKKAREYIKARRADIDLD